MTTNKGKENKMMKRIFWFVASLAMMFCSVSCVSGQQLVDNTQYSMPACKDFVAAVRKAAIGRRWSVTKVEPGKITCSLMVRQHTAVVDVVYDDKYFSIVYVDSSNMKYDPVGGAINKHYNNWVRNLARDIRIFASQQ